MINDYENMRRICYADDGYTGSATFIPVCSICGRFVKPNKSVQLTATGLADKPNAKCKKCGPAKMLFEGFF